MRTQTREHDWVKFTMAPIKVFTDMDHRPIPLVEPDEEKRAEENAQYGCRQCAAPLNEAFGTSCPGDDEEE